MTWTIGRDGDELAYGREREITVRMTRGGGVSLTDLVSAMSEALEAEAQPLDREAEAQRLDRSGR